MGVEIECKFQEQINCPFRVGHYCKPCVSLGGQRSLRGPPIIRLLLPASHIKKENKNRYSKPKRITIGGCYIKRKGLRFTNCIQNVLSFLDGNTSVKLKEISEISAYFGSCIYLIKLFLYFGKFAFIGVQKKHCNM